MPARIRQNGKRGAALFLVLMIISTLSVFGGILMVLSNNRVLMCQLEADRVKAIFLAEAGLADAVHELKTNSDPDRNGLGTLAEKKLGDGVYSVTHDPKTNEIRSSGTVNGVTRTLQIRYAVN